MLLLAFDKAELFLSKTPPPPPALSANYCLCFFFKEWFCFSSFTGFLLGPTCYITFRLYRCYFSLHFWFQSKNSLYQQRIKSERNFKKRKVKVFFFFFFYNHLVLKKNLFGISHSLVAPWKLWVSSWDLSFHPSVINNYKWYYWWSNQIDFWVYWG